MGRNSKRNKAITKMYLPRIQKYCQELEAQLEALKTDPNTTLGQVINQARELYTQNSRLSTLCAALLHKLGDKVELAKDTMTKYEGKRILIKWELPEGAKSAEETETFLFTYEIQDAPQPGQPVKVGPVSHEAPECTDPNCQLPKDLKHSHTVAPVPDANADITLTAEDGSKVEGNANITLNEETSEAEIEFTEPPTLTPPTICGDADALVDSIPDAVANTELIEPQCEGYTSPEQAQWEADHAGEPKQDPVQVDGSGNPV